MEVASKMKKVKCKKDLGVWYYIKLQGGELDAPIYELYKDNGQFENTFGSYSDMKYYIETGIVLGQQRG